MTGHLLRRVTPGSMAVLVLWLCGDFGAHAVINANNPANTNAPGNGVPWTNVGIVNGATGIYLGGGWGLSPNHVGPGPIDLDGAVFPYDGIWHRLTNSDGSATDMVVFHLSTAPSLPRLTLATRTPSAASQVDMIGYGRIAASGATNIGAYTGFYWTADHFKSWGNNRVNAGGVRTINVGMGDITVFTTDFTAPGPGQTSDESQAAQGDSGGGVFQLNGSTWELVGMLDAISNLVDQTADTSVYGDRTYSADIATYRSQIAAWMTSITPDVVITLSGDNVQVSWLDTGATYNLEASPSLSSPAWSVVTPSLDTVSGRICALLPATGGARFFRLRKP